MNKETQTISDHHTSCAHHEFICDTAGYMCLMERTGCVNHKFVVPEAELFSAKMVKARPKQTSLVEE